jgi:hypothetical protein
MSLCWRRVRFSLQVAAKCGWQDPKLFTFAHVLRVMCYLGQTFQAAEWEN